MDKKITYAKYPFPAVDIGNYEDEDGDAVYRECDIGYCNGLLPDGRPFIAEHYYDDGEKMDYLVVVVTADEMMDLDEIEGNLLGTEYQEEITKYFLQQGVITNANIRCDCMYLATDMDDNFLVVANYEMPGF